MKHKSVIIIGIIIGVFLVAKKSLANQENKELFEKIFENTFNFETSNGKRDEQYEHGTLISKYGIQQDTYNDYLKHNRTQWRGISKIDFAEAKKIYHWIFYDRRKVYLLPAFIQGIVFDYVFWLPKYAIEDLQKIVGAKIDGGIGRETTDKTVEYLNRVDVNTFIEKYNAMRWKRMQSRDNFEENKDGWRNRLKKLEQLYRKE